MLSLTQTQGLGQVVPKKKKKGKAKVKEKRPATQRTRVLARPNQPLGTSFEYDLAARAMRVTEFVSPDSVVCRSGVKVGMHLTEVDDLSVVGLKQDDVVFMLQRKAGSLRELLFEEVQVSAPVNDRSVLRTRSAASSSTAPHISTDEKEDSSQSRQLPQLTSPTTSSSPIRTSMRKLQPPPSQNPVSTSPEKPASPRRRKSQELQRAISSASQTSYAHMMKQGLHSTGPSSRPGGIRAHNPTTSSSLPPTNSSSRHDPFSTPARRRRLVADVARFLLKQYCTQACSLVHISRVRNRAATIIQCLFRCYRARLLYRRLLFLKHSAAAIRLQALFRKVAAKDILRKLQAQHRLKLAVDLAICLQCLSRVRRSRVIVARVRQEKTSIAIGVQRLLRGRIGRRRALQRRRQLEQLRNAKERAAIRLQSHQRRLVAERVLIQMRKIFELEMSMSSRIALHWRRCCRRRCGAAIFIQRVVRGRCGRKIAMIAALRRQDKVRQDTELRLMAREDHRASLLRAQHRVEIRVDLSPSLLSSLKRCKIATLIKWCVEQSVLKYEADDRGSYAMGDVIKQVLRATHSPSEPMSESSRHRARHVELQESIAPTLEKEKSLDIKQYGNEKQAIQLPTSSAGFPCRFEERYTGLPKHQVGGAGFSSTMDDIHTRIGRPLTLHITPTCEGGFIHMHLEPVFLYFATESERLWQHQLRKGKGASMDNPLSCPNLSSCDVHIILGTETDEIAATSIKASETSNSFTDGKYLGVGNEESMACTSDEEEMLKFRFKDVSVSVSVTTIVSGDDTTECLVNTKKKREEEERIRVEEEEKLKAKEQADLEATKALVAEINAAMAEAEQHKREEAERLAKRKAEEEAAAAAAIAARLKAANAGKRSRPTTATKRVKVSVIDEDAREKELLRKRLAEEEAERQRRLEAERLEAEKIRLARLQAIREKVAASCIQKHHRAHLLYRLRCNSAKVIQKFIRRRHLLRRWWFTVGQVIHCIDMVSISLQSRYRGYKARELVLLKRFDDCSNHCMQEADHWMNVNILNDFRFALGRSFISEGKKGYIIGQHIDEEKIGGTLLTEDDSVIENDSVVGSDDEGDSSDDEDDSDESDESEEEDYIINQRLSKNKITQTDIVNMEKFVDQLFACESEKDVSPVVPLVQDSTTSVLCHCSLEELSSMGAPVSLQGSGKWAAQLMHLLEFLPPPPRCVKPLEVLVEVPAPPSLVTKSTRINSEVIVAESSLDAPKLSPRTDKKAHVDSFGDLYALSDPKLASYVKNMDFSLMRRPPENAPLVYSMGCTNSSNLPTSADSNS